MLTVIIATHDMLVVNKFPSRTLKCENGEIVEMQNELS